MLLGVRKGCPAIKRNVERPLSLFSTRLGLLKVGSVSSAYREADPLADNSKFKRVSAVGRFSPCAA